MMDIKRKIELLKIERECVQRNSDGRCDRDCANCDLVQIDTDLLEMYDEVIKDYELFIGMKGEKNDNRKR